MNRQPQLLDELINKSDAQQEIDGRWYIAKPLSFFGFYEFRKRLFHAYLILTGKANAFQYAEDYFFKK